MCGTHQFTPLELSHSEARMMLKGSSASTIDIRKSSPLHKSAHFVLLDLPRSPLRSLRRTRAGTLGGRQRLALGPSWASCHAAVSDFLGCILPVSSPWGPWAALLTCGAIGVLAEKHTRLGKELSSALCSTLCGMLFANVGILPSSSQEIHLVFKYILPLAIPLLLLQANLLKILSQTGVQILTPAGP